jgi:hypothetical protein
MTTALLALNLAPTARVSWLQSTPAARLTADVGAFTMAGLDAGLTYAGAVVTARLTWMQANEPARLVADVGTFGFTGLANSFTYGGTAATARLTWLQASSGAGAYLLVANPGSFAYAGAPSFSDFEIAAPGAAFSFVGLPANLIRGGAPVSAAFTLVGNPGAFFLSGVGINVLPGRRNLDPNLVTAVRRSNLSTSQRPANIARS